VAAIDPGTQVPRLIEQADCGVVVAPDDSASFVVALQTVLSDTQRMTEMGHRARVFVESQASPLVVAHRYVDLMRGLWAR
jgi:glycosyltransferase involved in cell wall biosynthesis